MRFIAPVLGWLIFLGTGVQFLAGYGTRWEFGPYGFPVSLVASDGCHYLDGVAIDPITLALIRSGHEQDVGLALLVLLVIVVLWLCVELCKFHRLRAEYHEVFGRDFKPS